MATQSIIVVKTAYLNQDPHGVAESWRQESQVSTYMQTQTNSSQQWSFSSNIRRQTVDGGMVVSMVVQCQRDQCILKLNNGQQYESKVAMSHLE